MKKQELKFECYISIDGAEPVPLESLTAEEKAYASQKMTDRLSENMSRYYSAHPEQYARLCSDN